MRTCLLPATAALLLLACEREQRRFQELAPSSGLAQAPVQQGELRPGQAPQAPPTVGAYVESAWAIAEGRRYYQWFNCNGCHAMGGGGMGPPLMDQEWRYGSEPQNIYATIVEGRPNGMPSFRGKIPEQQVWQLVAYVRSMSGLVPADAAGGRPDALNARPSEAQMDLKVREQPRPEEAEHPR